MKKVVAYTCNASTWEVEQEESGTGNRSLLDSEAKFSLEYVRPSLKKGM